MMAGKWWHHIMRVIWLAQRKASRDLSQCFIACHAHDVIALSQPDKTFSLILAFLIA